MTSDRPVVLFLPVHGHHGAVTCRLTGASWRPTDDVEVGVQEDGAVFVGGFALKNRRVAELHVIQDEHAGGDVAALVAVQLCRQRRSFRVRERPACVGGSPAPSVTHL